MAGHRVETIISQIDDGTWVGSNALGVSVTADSEGEATRLLLEATVAHVRTVGRAGVEAVLGEATERDG